MKQLSYDQYGELKRAYCSGCWEELKPKRVQQNNMILRYKYGRILIEFDVNPKRVLTKIGVLGAEYDLPEDVDLYEDTIKSGKHEEDPDKIISYMLGGD